MRTVAPIALVAMLALRAAYVTAGEPTDWPGFRGPVSDGVCSANGVFDAAGVELAVAWKRTLGKGYSGVSIVGERAVTAFSDGESDLLVALDASDGRECWRVVLGPTYTGHDGSQDGPISTPCIHDGRVFTIGPRGRLVAVDLADGREVWSTDLIEDQGAAKPHWGFGTSPLVVSGVLVVEVGAGAKEAMLCGFDPSSGRRLWASGSDEVYYQSPVPFQHAGKTTVLAAGNTQLLCVEPTKGDVLWQFAHEGGGEYGSICMVPLVLDGGRIFLDHKDDTALLLGVAGEGKTARTERLWEERPFVKSYSVAVHHAGHLYGFNGRTTACVDAVTGKVLWRSRQPGDGFHIVVDEHLVTLTKEGSLHAAKLTAERYEEVARAAVFDELVWTPPSFARGSVFARSMGEIARIDVRASASPRPTETALASEIAGTRFALFLDELRGADDKSRAIDQFLANAGSFPLVEADGRVVFVYRGPGEDIAIGGDLTGFGNKLSMERVGGTDLFYAVARLERDARVGYGFVRDFQAIGDPLNPRKTTVSGFDRELELSFTDEPIEISWLAMPDWQAPAHFDVVDESRRGKIASHAVASKVLSADIPIDVYTPAGYDESSERYPVLYLHGGATARGGLQVADALDNLIGKRVAPVIAVFINRDPPFFGGEEYARMCATELPAFVDEQYRTVRAREGRAHVGWGFGAYGAMYSVLAHHEQAAKLGVQSPFMIDTTPIDPVLKTAAEVPLVVYLDWGKYDMRSRLEFWNVADMSRRLAEHLRERGYEPRGGEAHDGSGVDSWRNRLDEMFEALYPLKADR